MWRDRTYNKSFDWLSTPQQQEQKEFSKGGCNVQLEDRSLPVYTVTHLLSPISAGTLPLPKPSVYMLNILLVSRGS